MKRQIKSEAKLKLIEFIRYFSTTDSEEKDPFAFVLNGSREDAEAFVHRMRVEMSRFRNLVRERGRAPRPFKMILVSIENIGFRKQQVQLMKDDGAIQIAAELDEVFDEVAGGDLIK